MSIGIAYPNVLYKITQLIKHFWIKVSFYPIFIPIVLIKLEFRFCFVIYSRDLLLHIVYIVLLDVPQNIFVFPSNQSLLHRAFGIINIRKWADSSRVKRRQCCNWNGCFACELIVTEYFWQTNTVAHF